MTTYICFVIAMVILYVMKLFSGGFELTELLAYLIMILVMGFHVYLSTRKKAVWGIVVPGFIIASFYPVYRIIAPIGATRVILMGMYIIALVCCVYVWCRARKDNNN